MEQLLRFFRLFWLYKKIPTFLYFRTMKMTWLSSTYNGIGVLEGGKNKKITNRLELVGKLGFLSRVQIAL